MKRGQAKQRSGRGPDDPSDDDLLLLAVALVKGSGVDDHGFVAAVAVVFEALKRLKLSARSRRRPTDA
jgi:hypothetical protein